MVIDNNILWGIVLERVRKFIPAICTPRYSIRPGKQTREEKLLFTAPLKNAVPRTVTRFAMHRNGKKRRFALLPSGFL